MTHKAIQKRGSMLENLESKEPVPKIVLIAQGILALIIIIYIFMVIGGGTFTTFYTWIAACALGGATTLIALIKKRWLIAAIDIAATVLVFLSLFSLPF